MTAPRDKLAAARLYAIVDLGYGAEREAETVARALLDGGADVLQLRAKNYDQSRICELARRLAPLCAERGVPFIVNDFVEVARRSGASGVHLGQDDGALAAARAGLPEGALVGRSTHSLRQAATALAEGADYLGFGPLFPTPTKEGRPAIGLGEIAAVEREIGSHLPVFCIGGIKPDNLSAVLAAGARRVVMVSALLQAEDITARCRTVRELLNQPPNNQ
jgi:thiamine-phosphate pyrophosphorylase